MKIWEVSNVRGATAKMADLPASCAVSTAYTKIFTTDQSY